ncbi:hypothetical protein [Microbacterium terricola]|uniref:hypothetical protein n=1 Tax=Microbacterium terricola TaxID=344163 RepID=UPI0021E8E0A6|nr:hypothetical protein [Microbacterium terricola]UYK39527.1 hypothetical protein OAU46_12585 [Microbacterium terricola]
MVSVAALQQGGLTRAGRRSAVDAGLLVPVRRGWYVSGDVWRAWHREQRHLTQALAAWKAIGATSGAVLSHTCAAAAHGLPLFRLAPRQVHVIDPRSDGRVRPPSLTPPTPGATVGPSTPLRTTPFVARHAVALGAGDVVHIAGVAVTDLPRTVGDLIGRVRPETAVALADAALRKWAWDDGSLSYDDTGAQAFTAQVRASPALQRGQRGVVQARWVLDFADGRAQGPGESVSRLYLHLLGFAAPRLQVRIALETSTHYLDFGLDDVGAWGEFDGEGKYFDREMTHGADALDVLRAEKQREDSIRAATGRILARWGMKHLSSVAALGQQLALYGIRPPIRQRSLPAPVRAPAL